MKALRIFMMVMLLALPLFASQAMAQPTITCPPGIYTYHENGGPYSTNPNKWTADAGAGQTVTNVIVFSTPPGITATVDFTILPGGQTAEGYVDITVTNYCQTPGGNIVLEAQTTAGNDQCPFLVTLTNTDPVITCPVDASFDWNVGYTGTATADDPEEGVLTTGFTLVSGPAGLIVAANGDITWTTACTDVNVVPYNVVVQVADECGATDQCPFQLTVTNPATFTCPNDEKKDAIGSYTTATAFVANSGDNTVDIVSVSISAPPPGISIPAPPGDINWIQAPPAREVSGTVNYTVSNHCATGGSITLEATDDCIPSNTIQCAFDVTLNTDPVITCPVDASFDWNVGYTGTATAIDPEEGALATGFTLVSGPPGLTVAANGDITWTTVCTDVNVVPYDVVVQVVDGCGATDQCLLPFQLTVTNPATFDPIPPQTNYSNATYTVGFTVNSNSVLNIGSVGILAGPLPPGIASASLINVAGIGTGTVTGDIQYVVDDHCLAGGTITVEAADDCGTPNTVTGDLVVTLTNTHPVITCPANMIGLFNVTMISADFVKTDPEGDLVTVTITDVTPAPANMPTVVVDHVEWLPTLADVLLGPITVELTATDQCGASDPILSVCTFTMTAVKEWTFTCDQNPDPVDPPWVAPGDLKVNIMKITILNYTGTGDGWLARIVVTSECDDDADVSAVYIYDGAGTTMLGQDLNGFDAGMVAFEWTASDPARELPDQGSAEFLIVFDIATGILESHLGNDLDVRIDPDQVFAEPALLYGVIGPDLPGCGVGPPVNVIELDPEPPLFTAASINFTYLSTGCAIRCGMDYTLQVHNIVDNNPHPLAVDLCDIDPNHPGVELKVNLERFGEAVDQLMDCDNANPLNIFYDYDGSVPKDDIAEGIDIPANHEFAPDYILTVTATDWLGNSRTVPYTKCPYPIDTKWPDLDPDVDITFEWQDFGNDGFISVGDELTIKIDMSNQPPYGTDWEILHKIFHKDPPCGPFTYEGVRVEQGAWPDFHMGKWDPTGTEFAYPINFSDDQADANEVWEFIFIVPPGNLDVDADDPESKILFTLEDNAGYWPVIPCCIAGNIREAESPAVGYPVDNWPPNITDFSYDWAAGGDQGCLNIMEIGDKILITANLTGNPNGEVAEVTVDLRTLGGSQYEHLYDDGTNGDDVDGDKIWHLEWTIQDPGPDGGDWSPAGTRHELWITVCDNGGNSIQDNYLSPYVVDTDMPDPVENLIAQAQAGGVIHLEWEDPVNPDIMTYHIYCGTGSISDIDYTIPCGNTPGGDLDWDSGPLTDGTVYCFGIRSEDDACNLEENTHVVVCATADAIAPTANFLSPATGSCFKAAFTVIAKSSDLDIDEFHFWYRIKGGPDPTWLDGGTAPADDQVGSRDLNLGMVSEVYEVLVTAKDVAGNEQAQADAYTAGQYIEVIWDLEAPSVQITQINGDHNPSGVTLNAGVNEICVIAQDNMATTFDVWLQLDDGTNPPPPRYLVEEDVSISLTTEYCFEFSLANWVTNDCEVTVILMDCPGNEGTKTLSLPVEDIIPVECRMSKPTHLQAVPQSTDVEVEAECLGDVSEVSLCEFYYRETGNGSWQKFYTTVAHVGDFFTGYWDNTGLVSGAYDLKAHMYDDAVPANVCETPFITVFIDVEGPNIALHIDGVKNLCSIDKICGGEIDLWAEILDPTIDVVDVEFFYKRSSEPDFLYQSIGNGTPANNATIYTLTHDITTWDDETSYDIKAVPTDAAGNEGDPSIVTVFKDCTAPDVAFTDVTTPSATFTNPSTKLGGSGEVYAAKDDTICMEVSVLSSQETCGLEKVEYSLFVGTDWQHIGTSTAPDDSFLICFEPLGLGLILPEELVDGHWEGDVRAVLYDSLGNSSEDIITLYILDVDPSQAIIVEPENDSYVWGDVDLSVMALNAYEICKVCYEYSEDRTNWLPVNKGVENSCSTNKPYFPIPWHTLNTVPDGVYYLHAVATDCDNNVDDDPPTIQVTVANGLPTVTILDPSICFRECPDDPVDTIGFVGDEVLVQATVDSDIPVERVEFYYKDIFTSNWGVPIDEDDSPTDEIYDVLWNTRRVDDGRYHLKARVYNEAGRYNDSEPIEVFVDNTDPRVNIVSINGETHPGDMDVTQYDTLAVQVVAYDDQSTAGATRCYNSGVVSLGFTVEDGDGLSQYNWFTDFHDGDTLFYWNVSGLLPGEYYVKVRAVDCLGNDATHSVTIQVTDITPPMVVIGGFYGNYVYGYEDDGHVDSLKLEYRKIEGADTSDWMGIGEPDEYDKTHIHGCITACVERTFYQWSWIPSASLKEGVSYQARILSTDKAGNTSELYAPIVNFTYAGGVIVPESGPLSPLSFEKNFESGDLHGIVKQTSDYEDEPQMFGLYLPTCGSSEIECVWMQQSQNVPTHFKGSFDAQEIRDGGSGMFFSSVTLTEGGAPPMTGEGQLYTYLRDGDILVVKVDKDLGTWTTYCTEDSVCVWVPGGAVNQDRHLVVWPKEMPLLSLEQPTWIPVGDDNGFATYVGFTTGGDCFDLYAKIRINYSSTLNVPAESLIVAWWDATAGKAGMWSTTHLYWGYPYTDGFNTEEHYVEFVAECLEGPFAVIHLLERECEGSIVVKMRESDIEPYCNGYTNSMPRFTALITDNVRGPSAIEQASINFKLDLYESGELITIYDKGTWADGFGCFPHAGHNTTSGIFKAGWDPYDPAVELEEGDHIATVSAQNDNLNWCNRTLNFKVDDTPPDVVWHPIWVSGEKPAFKFAITDELAGVNKDSIWIDIYDADESGQPYEKDLLLTIYPDGVDEFWTDDTTLYVELINPCDGQYVHVVIYDGFYKYDFADDILQFRRAYTGGVRDCVDNKASAEHLVFPIDRVSPQCSFVTSTYANPVKILVTDPVDTVFQHTYKQGSGVDVNSFKITENGVEVTSFTYKSATNILTYTPTVSGPIEVVVTVKDMMGNEGGIEFNNWDQDADGPEITWTSLTEKPIRISITDAMSGVDWSTLKFYEDGLLICEGLDCTDEAVVIDATSGVIEYSQPAGRIHVEIQVRDNAGNLSDADFYTEEENLAFMDPHNYPNPFDPREGRTTIDPGLSKSAYVTVKIYDFAGEYVATIVTNQYVSTSEYLYWDGTSEGGTEVANGTYLCYIKAKDSNGATKTAVIKITVLKQDK